MKKKYGVGVYKITPGADGWQELANAIVYAACYDYASALEEYIKNPNEWTEHRMREELSFFESDYCERICAVDAEILVQGAREEAREWIKRSRKRKGAIE